jgi:hypothetical protein
MAGRFFPPYFYNDRYFLYLTGIISHIPSVVVLDAEPGAWDWTGYDVSLTYGRIGGGVRRPPAKKKKAEPKRYWPRTYPLVAEPGAYAMRAIEVSLQHTYHLRAAPSIPAMPAMVADVQALLCVRRVLHADDSYTATHTAAQLNASRRLRAYAGSYAVGCDAALSRWPITELPQVELSPAAADVDRIRAEDEELLLLLDGEAA